MGEPCWAGDLITLVGSSATGPLEHSTPTAVAVEDNEVDDDDGDERYGRMT